MKKSHWNARNETIQNVLKGEMNGKHPIYKTKYLFVSV